MVVSSMSYATYERYKESGVDWLGAIPSDWDVEESKWLFSCRKEKANKNDEQLTASQKYGVIPQQVFMDLEERRVTVVYLNPEILKHVEKGDFVISMRSFQGGIEYCDYTGSVSSAYVPLIPNNLIFSPFFKYLFKSSRYIEALQSTSNLVRDGQALRYDNFCMIPLPVVPNETQIKIANFLDQKTAQIDQAIALKQQQIEKLGEYKQIVIQNAVTKGLNPNAPMKDSGVAWIGDIPEHWEMVSIKRIAKISPKVDLSNYKLDEKVTFLPMEKVSSNGDIDCEILKPIRELKQGFTAFKKNDVILAKITPCFENGKGALLDKLETEIGYGSTEFHVLRASKRIKAYYLYLITHSSNFLTLGEAMMTGSAGQKRVPTDFVANYQFPLPPMSEQQQIIEYVENLNRKISDTIQSYQTQIDRLKEYKNILINQAVTGKIKI